MRDRRKRKQREEVRKILHTMRLELAAQRVALEHGSPKVSVLNLADLLTKAKKATD